jgi:hypothetical protein
MYGYMKSLLLVIKLEIMAAYSYIIHNDITARSLNFLFFPIFIILLFGTIFYYIKKTKDISKTEKIY